MAITDENGGIGATMLVGPTGYGAMPYPVYQNGNGGNNGGWGNDWAWIIILLLAFGGGFNRGFGGNGGFGGGSGDGYGLYPWLNNSNQINDGFRDQMLQNSVTSVRDGLFDISTQLCNGFAGVNATINSTAANAETAANARAMANMQQIYGLSSQFADCCCENRLATADLKYTIATEECATRSANAMNTRDIVDSQTRGTQIILDKLCQLELDNYKRENDQLRGQLTDARFAASQVAQTAQIRDGQVSAVSALVNELRSCPIPAQPVYGSQPIFTCPNNNNGCGSGCGNGAF